jgi:hypothetical protein
MTLALLRSFALCTTSPAPFHLLFPFTLEQVERCLFFAGRQLGVFKFSPAPQR